MRDADRRKGARRCRSGHAGLGIALAVILLGPSGCGLFETRTPEGGGGESEWIPPLTPQQVVENLETALLAGNFGDYTRTFTPEFRFVPDATDVATIAVERPGEPVYENWDADVETATMQQIYASADGLDLSLVLFEERIEGDTRLLKYEYTLGIVRAEVETLYQGEAWFRVVQLTGGEWFILTWEDVITDDTETSWGLLKGRERTL
jgi:hypothetical protein